MILSDRAQRLMTLKIRVFIKAQERKKGNVFQAKTARFNSKNS